MSKLLKIMKKFFERTWPALIFFFLLPIGGLSLAKGDYIHLYVHVNSEFWNTVIISISTSLFSSGLIYLFIDNRLKELIATDDQITIILKSPKDTIDCPPMSRKDFTRSEVMGYIGMTVGQGNFDMNPDRFKEIAEQIRVIQQSKGDQKLVLQCTEDEMTKFTASC
ncbi:hypothetical protein [Celerinatantimonas sp. MCCC 1A17872]|uniref:hypothetical protein n=1 Tax=Celerinatantimonas sp. MCCC 1A17872 TaxID=3177514 RepID=UPI0038BF48C8